MRIDSGELCMLNLQPMQFAKGGAIVGGAAVEPSHAAATGAQSPEQVSDGSRQGQRGLTSLDQEIVR